VSPARTAILRDVLVSGGGGEVDAADISPVKVRGKILGFDIRVRKRLRDPLRERRIAELDVAFQARGIVALTGQALFSSLMLSGIAAKETENPSKNKPYVLKLKPRRYFH